MKKKLVLVLITILAMVAILTGCISKPPHKMLSDPWEAYEKITYEVTRTLKDDDDNAENNKKLFGTSTIITERKNNVDCVVGDKNFPNFSGSLVSISTEMEDGSIMNSAVAFTPSLEPIASYKYIKVKQYTNNEVSSETEQKIQMTYIDEHCEYTCNIDGVQTNGKEKVGKWIKKPYYDNLMLYHIVRSSYLKDTFTSLSANVMSVDGFKMKTLTATAGAPIVFKNDENNTEDKGIAVDRISIALQQKFPGSGTPMQVWLSKDITEEAYCGMKFTTKRVPVKIIESEMTYKIKEYTSNK